MRRRREEEDSSLELLLDTMCNTFGGVMFIAISIFVIISGMTEIESASAPQTDPTQLRREIESLRLVISDLEKQIRLKNADIQLKRNSDAEARLREIVLLENLIKNMKMKITAEKAQKDLLLRQAQDLSQKLSQTSQQQDKAVAELRLLQHNIEQLKQQQTALQNRRTKQPEMIFKIIESSEQAPFFIVIRRDLAFPVGPWEDSSGKYRIDDAVESRTDNTRGTVECKVKPDRGIKILNGDALSSDFQDLLLQIPSGRVPKFNISPDSARTVHIMREILKKQNLLHGCSLATDDQSNFTFQYTQDADYEY